jgi:hypothetical protein
MLSTAQRLVMVDPMNRSALRLVAQAWQIKGKTDSALHYVTIADSLLPVELSVSNFSPGDSSVSIRGLITNFHERPSAPLKIVFEFLNSGGTAVVSQPFDVGALDAGGTQPFQVQATGTGLVSWRYHRE